MNSRSRVWGLLRSSRLGYGGHNVFADKLSLNGAPWVYLWTRYQRKDWANLWLHGRSKLARNSHHIHPKLAPNLSIVILSRNSPRLVISGIHLITRVTGLDSRMHQLMSRQREKKKEEGKRTFDILKPTTKRGIDQYLLRFRSSYWPMLSKALKDLSICCCCIDESISYFASSIPLSISLRI